MASIHVVYDPKSKISGMSPEQLKSIGASAVVMHIDAPTIDNIDATITMLVEAILEQVGEDT
jgi:hypothetical protein